MTKILTDLSTEVIIKIFEYCTISDLYTLQQTCKRFYEVIKKATTLGNVKPILITNQLQCVMRNRCVRLLVVKEKCRISQNWKNGIYKEFSVTKFKKRYIPHLILQKDSVWLSKANQIYVYKRNKFENTNLNFIQLPKRPDICKFSLKGDYVISGQRDGSIFIHNSKTNYVHLESCHKSDVEAIDIIGNIIVSGSKDTFVKLWPLKSDLALPCMPIASFSVGDRVWSTASHCKNEFVAVGTDGLNYVSPLKIFDLNRFIIISELGKNFPHGAGVLGLKWETSNILLSCGYDNCIRKWDIRIGKCVQIWEDPFDSTIYCFDTDNYCSLLSGTQSNGRVVLWDMRTVRYVQMYFMETCKKSTRSSPIYSLSFDAFQLFTATDYNLNVLDFSVKSGVPKNYCMFGGV